TEARDVIGKVREEVEEVAAEFESNASTARIADELGDLLFACVNLARKAGVDPGMALRGANLKFDRRFRRIETFLAAAGRTPEQATLEEMEALWVQAKIEERSNG
ncbi:MAG: nucleoside triphosphate pyrophosphohydrolase, partial [Rhodospirillaceae bacterium]